MKEIQLTQNQIALVDDEDYETLAQFKWCAKKDKNTYYATRFTRENGKREEIRMHIALMGAKGIDHKDGNGLNNQRNNLRFATQQQNLCNRRPFKNNSSGFKGVYWNKGVNKWQANIRHNGILRHLGLFATAEEAAHAHDTAAKELRGEYTRLNFPEQ